MGEINVKAYLEELKGSMSEVSWKMMRRHILRKPDLVGAVFEYSKIPLEPTDEDKKEALRLLEEMV